MRTPLIYISGPMTGLPDHNFPSFNDAATRLERLGYQVYNPADRGIIDGWEWEDYLRDDLAELVKCGAIYFLPGWRNSRGARLEHHVALELGLSLIEWQWTAAEIARELARRELSA